jgi:tartrate dehydratase beta subunit/fumarate hydratase class I family protein
MQTKNSVNTTTVRSRYQFQIDVGLFWIIAKSIRQSEKTPEYVDHHIALIFARPNGCSDWLRQKLEELRELNRKRFS